MTEPMIGEFTGNFNYNKFTSKFKPIKNNFELTKTPQSRRYVSGADMIVHRNVFDAIGLLNHRTFLYFGELDFTYRARKLGYLQEHIEGPVVQHSGAGSSEGKSMNAVRMSHESWSTLDFCAHHHKVLFPVMLTLRIIIRCLTLSISGRHKQVKTVLRATIDFLEEKNQDLILPDIRNVSQFRFNKTNTDEINN